jgi:hypothetical protein
MQSDAMKKAILETLAEVKDVKDACKIVGIGKRTVYGWREYDPVFKRDWNRVMKKIKEELSPKLPPKMPAQPKAGPPAPAGPRCAGCKFPIDNEIIIDGSWQSVFLQVYAHCGNQTSAAKVAGVPRWKINDERKANFDFAAGFDNAQECAADNLEQEGMRRAMERSDTLLIFLLKGLRPEKYRERATLSSAELDKLIEKALEQRTAERSGVETQLAN